MRNIAVKTVGEKQKVSHQTNIKGGNNKESKIKELMTRLVEWLAPGIIERQSVNTPILTGLKVLDALIPVGRGQRELVIGDRQTGKTTLLTDMILNQKNIGEVDLERVYSIYASIGQKASTLISVVNTCFKNKVTDTIFVTAPASYPAPLQYLCPYAACSVGE
jgi:F0F1-type ATP synthase alpha subunit